MKFDHKLTVLATVLAGAMPPQAPAQPMLSAVMPPLVQVAPQAAPQSAVALAGPVASEALAASAAARAAPAAPATARLAAPRIAVVAAAAPAASAGTASGMSSSAPSGPPLASRLQPCVSVVLDAPSHVTLGKSSVIRLPMPIVRMVVGGQGVRRAAAPLPVASDDRAAGARVQAAAASDGVADVDITLLSPTELFFLGKKPGSMNVVLQSASGECFVRDIIVTVDPGTLQAQLKELMPEETGIRVLGAESSLVLSGKVSDAAKLDEILTLANSYGDGKKVVNLLRVSSPQQVMLEVKIAEVSKTLLDRFGIDYTRLLSSGGSARFFSGVFGGAPAAMAKVTGALDLSGTAAGGLGAVAGASLSGIAGVPPAAGNATLLGIDAQKRDGLIRILAEPNIMAISGQSAGFNSGGRIFIPVPQSGGANTLEEKQFGVILKFMPTVLDGSRINLKLMSEVSELAQSGASFSTIGGATAVLPSITARTVDTTVQLNDGQSFAIAGLIRNNISETISRFPGLGDVPVLGALFRSTEFQKEQTELLFVVTPRLVKPLVKAVMLPTDNLVEPNRAEVLFMGLAEGKGQGPAQTPAPRAAAVPAETSPAAASPTQPAMSAAAPESK